MSTLHIIASPRGERSKSIELGKFAVERIGGENTSSDLFIDNVPYLSESVIALNYGFAKYEDLTPKDQIIVDLQTRYIKELTSAETLIISVPMWNFSMPAVLKAWFDLIIKVNTTFSMGPEGYKGLVHNVKKVIIVGARGGVYQNTAFQAYDMLEPQIRALLSFIGITNIETYWIEGVNMNPEATEENMAKIKEEMSVNMK